MEKEPELYNEYECYLGEKIFDKYKIFDGINYDNQKYRGIVRLYFELGYTNLSSVWGGNLSKQEFDKNGNNIKYILTKTLQYIKPFIQKGIVTVKVLKRFSSDKEIGDYLKDCRDKTYRDFIIKFFNDGGIKVKPKNYSMLLPEKIFTKDDFDDFESIILDNISNLNDYFEVDDFLSYNTMIELTPECREFFEKERKEMRNKTII